MSYITPEKKVQNDIIKYLDDLKQKGYPLEYFRRDAIGLNYKKGLPDLFILVYSRHIEVECKAPGKSTSTLQDKWIERFKRVGIPVIVADSLNLFINSFTNLVR